MSRKAPWHSPSECSFDFGYRVGHLAGKIAALRKAINFPELDESDEYRLRGTLSKLLAKQRLWKQGRPK